MASRKQIAANHRNARKSTGPCTPEGKNASRFNALKSGIDARSQVLPDESPEDLDALAAEYHARFRPATPEARALVDTLVSSEWQLRRLRRAEPVLWAYAAERCRTYEADPDEPAPNEIGRILNDRAEVFARLQRRIDSAERNFLRALKELRRIPAEAEPEPASDAPQPIEPEPLVAPSPEIGFVPQIREPALPAAAQVHSLASTAHVRTSVSCRASAVGQPISPAGGHRPAF
jgi:hypothetical protein